MFGGESAGTIDERRGPGVIVSLNVAENSGAGG
jgi:hypothetical protein